MKAEFKLVSCEPQSVMREVEVDGAKINVPVPGVIAQLVPAVENGSGTLKLAVSAEFQETFQANVGQTATIEVSFSKGE